MHLVRTVGDASPREITCGTMRELTSSKDFPGMDIVHVTIGSETKRHYHKRLTEVYFVLKGSIVMEVDGKKEGLKEGGMVMIFPNTEHKAWKASKGSAEILVICCPPWTKEDEVLTET